MLGYKEIKPNLTDVYFIFADDVFMDKIPYSQFVILIKFYSLLYKRIVIPDSFVVNNKNLHKFLFEDEGLMYIKSNIIIFTMRSEIDNVSDLLNIYIENKTLNNDIDKENIRKIAEDYNFKNTLKWHISDVSNNFSQTILNSYKTIELPQKENEQWYDIISTLNSNNNLTRQSIYNEAIIKFGLNNHISKSIMKHADIVYNFNLPNLFNISSAYPERLLSNKILSPEKIFFYGNSNLDTKFQPEDLFSEEIIFLDEPLLFYTEVLKQLTFEQILEIRKTNEFKEYMNSIKKNESDSMKTSFYKYCEMCNQLIANMISVNGIEIKKINSRLQISKKAEATTGEIMGIALGLIPMGNLISIPLNYLVSKGIEITGKSLRRKNSVDYDIKRIDAKHNIKKVIKDNPNTVLDDINKCFQINKLR